MRAVFDWTRNVDPRLLQAAYLLSVRADGLPTMEVPISSWQATANEGERASFVQAVIPAAADWIAALGERINGRLVIRMGYRFEDGSERFEDLIESSFTDFRYDRGPRNATATLSGYAYLGQTSTGTRALRDVQQVSQQGGKYRVTCALDLSIRPGMTVQFGAASFPASFINYYVNRTGAFCQIGER